MGEDVTIYCLLFIYLMFIQYIPTKPAKYGIKIFVSDDSSVYYTCNMEMYAGK